MSTNNRDQLYGPMSYVQDFCLYLQQMRQDQVLCDCKIVSGSKCFPLHRCVLIAASDVFKNYFYEHGGGEEEVTEIKDIWINDSQVFETILDFVYTGVLNVKQQDFQTLIKYLEANQTLKIKGLDQQLANKARFFIKSSNIETFVQLADKYENEFVMEECLRITKYVFDEIVRRRYHVTYDEKTLTKILNATIFTRNPLIILECILSWCRDDKTMAQFKKLMNFVPLEMLTADELLKVITNSFVYNSPQIQKKVQKSILEYLNEQEYGQTRNLTRQCLGGKRGREGSSSSSQPNEQDLLYFFFPEDGILEFNPKNARLKIVQNLKVKSENCMFGSVQGKLLIFNENLYSNRLRLFIHDTTKTINKCTEIILNQAPMFLEKGKSVTIDDEIFMIVKCSPSNELTVSKNLSLISYHLKTNKWTFHPRIPVPVKRFALTATKNTLYILGGTPLENSHENSVQLVQSYDIRLRMWDTHVASLPKPMSDIVAIVFEGKIFVFGSQSLEVYSYVIANNTWVQHFNLIQRHKNPFAFLNHGKIIIVGGFLNYYEIYDPMDELNGCQCIEYKNASEILLQTKQIQHAVSSFTKTFQNSTIPAGQIISIPSCDERCINDITNLTIEEHEVYQSHIVDCHSQQKRLLLNLNSQRLQHPELCDTKLIVKDGEVSAHTFVLSFCSEYFKILFLNINDYIENKTNTVNFADRIDGKTMNTILEFFYTGTLRAEIDIEMIFQLILWSNYLLSDTLFQEVTKYLRHKLNIENVSKILAFCNDINNYNLRKMVMQFIMKNFKRMVKLGFIQFLEWDDFFDIIKKQNQKQKQKFYVKTIVQSPLNESISTTILTAINNWWIYNEIMANQQSPSSNDSTTMTHFSPLSQGNPEKLDKLLTLIELEHLSKETLIEITKNPIMQKSQLFQTKVMHTLKEEYEIQNIIPILPKTCTGLLVLLGEKNYEYVYILEAEKWFTFNNISNSSIPWNIYSVLRWDAKNNLILRHGILEDLRIYTMMNKIGIYEHLFWQNDGRTSVSVLSEPFIIKKQLTQPGVLKSILNVFPQFFHQCISSSSSHKRKRKNSSNNNNHEKKNKNEEEKEESEEDDDNDDDNEEEEEEGNIFHAFRVYEEEASFSTSSQQSNENISYLDKQTEFVEQFKTCVYLLQNVPKDPEEEEEEEEEEKKKKEENDDDGDIDIDDENIINNENINIDVVVDDDDDGFHAAAFVNAHNHPPHPHCHQQLEEEEKKKRRKFRLHAAIAYDSSTDWYYVIGGETPNGKRLNSVWRYEPATQIWKALKPLPEPRSRASAVWDHDRGCIYLFGGVTEFSARIGQCEMQSEIYDIGADEWYRGPVLQYPKAHVTVLIHQDQFYLLGGKEFHQEHDAFETMKSWTINYNVQQQIETVNRFHRTVGTLNSEPLHDMIFGTVIIPLSRTFIEQRLKKVE